MDTTSIQVWRRTVRHLANRLRIDMGHDLRRLAPWTMAALSMVNSWQIRLSRPPAKGNARVAPRPTWKVFAQRGTGLLTGKRRHAHKSDWHLWAGRRKAPGSRYIPKRNRKW